MSIKKETSKSEVREAVVKFFTAAANLLDTISETVKKEGLG